jgi:hypothetical protein
MYASGIDGSITMKDPIIQELWEIKDRIAKEHGNNIDKLAKKLQQKEKSKRPVTLVKSKKVNR